MSDNIIQLNEKVIKTELKDLVRNSVEETLNNLLNQEADELLNASKYGANQRSSRIPFGSLFAKSIHYIW